MERFRTAKRKPGRPKPVEGQRPVSRSVLRTASLMFMELGYDSVSLEQIASAAGVTKASVYYYYHNKANLFTEAVAQMMTDIRIRTKAILDGGQPLQTRLELIATAYMQHTHVDFESLLREAGKALSAEQVETIRAAERSVHVELASVFEREMDAGSIRAGDPMLYAYAFAALMMLGARKRSEASSGSREKPVQNRSEDISRMASAVVGLFWNGAAML